MGSPKGLMGTGTSLTDRARPCDTPFLKLGEILPPSVPGVVQKPQFRMGENSLSASAAGNRLHGCFCLFICLVSADQKQPGYFLHKCFEVRGGFI